MGINIVQKNLNQAAIEFRHLIVSINQKIFFFLIFGMGIFNNNF